MVFPKLYPSLLGRVLFFLLAAAGLGQGPPVAVIFNVKPSANFKSVAMGAAHCDFWSHIAVGYPLESACYRNATAKPQISVYNLTDIVVNTFMYCEDGQILPPTGTSSPVTLLAPACHAGVPGGTFTWELSPSATTPGLTNFTLSAWPLGNNQSSESGTF